MHFFLSFAFAFVGGVAGVAVVALLVVATALALNGSLLVIIQTGFGGSGWLTALLVVGGMLAALGAAALVGRLLRRRWLPLLRTRLSGGVAGWLGMVAGAVLGLCLGAWMVPEPIASSAREFLTGESARQRAERPVTQAIQQRLQLLLAAHPEGPEAALIAAVNRTATPVPRPGRQLDGADLRARLDALQQLLPTVPPGWQTVVLGTMAEIQRGHIAGSPTHGPLAKAQLEASRTGSRAMLVLSAQLQEEIAHYAEKAGEAALADAAWQRALQAYMAAGAAFEVARFYDEALPERLRNVPVPVWSIAPSPPVDSVLAQRLASFAQALGDDMAWDSARPGARDLAVVAALVALELSPAPSAMALSNPAQRWAQSPWALARWILALRHARGDCMAALELSQALGQRRRVLVSWENTTASELDLAWAVAWMEAGGVCASSDEERAQVQMRKSQLDYLRFAPGALEAARSGVAATVAGLR
jgi:hypothetical protein